MIHKLRALITRALDKITNGVPTAEERFGTYETVYHAWEVRNVSNAKPVSIDGKVN